MAFQVSPGVQIKEIDLSNVVPAVSSTVGAFAGTFQWGPVDEVKTVSSTQELIDEFYEPRDTLAGAEDFYTADSFLKYGSALRVVRMSTSQLFSANVDGATTTLLKNREQYDNSYADGSQEGTVGEYIAKYAGALGNNLKISVCASSNGYFNNSASNVNSGSGVAAAQTTIPVTTGEGANFVVRDIIKFSGHDTKYRITAIATDNLTIESIGTAVAGGLTSAVVDDEAIDRYWEFYELFDKKPEKSAVSTAAGGAADEIHLVVVDEDGGISGTRHTVLEVFPFLSLASDGKDSQGRSNFYRTVLADQSEWIYWAGHDTDLLTTATGDRTIEESKTTAFGRPDLPQNYSLSGGKDGRSKVAGDITDAWDKHFKDAETIDISFLVCGSTRTDNGSGTDQDTVADHNTIVNHAISIAEHRKDCMVVASPRRASLVNVTSESTQSSNVEADFASVTSSSYAVFDSGWVYMYDRYNDKYCWVPGNGHTAGIMVRSDLLQDPWYSPAGFSRGQYLGITKLAFNPKKQFRDDLYRKRINPIVTFPGQGTVLFGDKTGLSSPSAFDRINVRRLFIVLEKAIAVAAKSQLFEFNDAFTRAQFRSAVEPFLRDVRNRRGLIDFSVVCDESNNTDSVIDRNEFVCSIFVKPNRSINFITLNFVASRSGVEFEELYGAV